MRWMSLVPVAMAFRLVSSDHTVNYLCCHKSSHDHHSTSVPRPAELGLPLLAPVSACQGSACRAGSIACIVAPTALHRGTGRFLELSKCGDDKVVTLQPV
ncbi:hypothetical protein EDB19DRAFT_280576 [Suillus lakei]|nr:hypothetical protein EDB19DRAFT_280576 [Suillus lakei]